MAALHQLEFYLLRYTGDATKSESINLGVLAISRASIGGDFADVRFIRNWHRLNCFDPLADAEELQMIEREIRRDLQDPQRGAELVKRLNDSWSNVIRFDQLKGCLTDSPALEMERLSATYLDAPPAEKRGLRGRRRIVGYIRDELEKAGVLQLMQRDIPVAEYTRTGDPLKLDFGYAVEGAIKFVQAVSLAQRVDSAMLLASRFAQIAAGIKEKKGAQAWLTAVVEDDLPPRNEATFAMEMMQDSGITLAPLPKVPEIAEGIRLELNPRS